MSSSPDPQQGHDGPPGSAPARESAGRPSSSPWDAQALHVEATPRVRHFPLLPDFRAAAQLWLDPEHSSAPVTAQDAACTVLIRDSPRGVETYLTAHERRSPLGPVAFPGGRVAAADDEPVAWSGPTSQQWAAALHDDVGSALRAVMAAARTLFVSTGVLLAGRRSDSTITTTGGLDWMPLREDVAGGQRTLSELLAERRLVLRSELLRPMARWVTAEFVHRRYDIRYFLVILPERQEPVPLRSRDRPGAWVSPAEILQRRAQEAADPSSGEAAEAFGDLHRKLTPATVLLLEELARAPSAIAAAAHRPHLEPRMPRLEQDQQGRLRFAVDRPSAGRRRR